MSYSVIFQLYSDGRLPCFQSLTCYQAPMPQATVSSFPITSTSISLDAIDALALEYHPLIVYQQWDSNSLPSDHEPYMLTSSTTTGKELMT